MTSRISTPTVESASGETAKLFDQIKKAAGGVPNAFAAIGSLSPAALKAVLAADAVASKGTLGKKDLETIKLIVSEVAGCDYCVAAHTALGKLTGLSPDVVVKIRAGHATGDPKRDAAFS
jgi:AhpD family alkylhydroperoxidase